MVWVKNSVFVYQSETRVNKGLLSEFADKRCFGYCKVDESIGEAKDE